MAKRGCFVAKKRKKKTAKRKLIEKLEFVIRTYIRVRDKDTCQRCGKRVFGSESHTSHVIPKSHGNVLRFDEYNLKLLCSGCHLQWWHLNPLDAGAWFKRTFPDRYEYLESKRTNTTKFTESDYEIMIEEYEDKIAGIEITINID